jgi:hypothetical protein
LVPEGIAAAVEAVEGRHDGKPTLEVGAMNS